jgi:hypothetical protein
VRAHIRRNRSTCVDAYRANENDLNVYTQEEKKRMSKLTTTAERPLRDCWNKLIWWVFLGLRGWERKAPSDYAISVPLRIDHTPTHSAWADKIEEKELICVTFFPLFVLADVSLSLSLVRCPSPIQCSTSIIIMIIQCRWKSFDETTLFICFLQRCS